MAKNKKNDVDSFSGLFLGIEESNENLNEPVKTIKEEPIKETSNEPVKEVVEEPIKVSEPANTQKQSSPEDALVIIPQKEEVKSKRVNLLLKPSVHQKAQKKCNEIGVSLNDCISQLLEKWINQ